MLLNENQVNQLLGLVTTSEPDPLDCDSCFEHLAEFAEAELIGKEVPAALQSVQVHLEQCKCCGDEYNALLQALKTIEN